MKQFDEQIVLRVEKDDRQALERLAAAQHRKLANYLRCLVKDHLEAAKQSNAMVA
ncbi:hypothetical protein AB8Z38_03085 [Bradyrhizobium sp. LLZ17]|uniref:DNA-binding protein n=1 Tax=Bradyrhizobium sp. LLZ17 TaxID=3239388 RepID=A0AB39XNV9_9BRAD